MNGRHSGGGRKPPPDDIRAFWEEGPGGAVGILPPGAPGGAPPGFPATAAGAPAPGARDRYGFQIDSPYVVRPPFGVDLRNQGDAAGLSNANTPAILAQFQVPTESVAVVRSLVLTVNNLLLTSDIYWTLRFNGSAVPGWERLAATPGPVLYYVKSYGPDEAYIRVPEGNLITLEFTVTAADAANYLAGCEFGGWYFSKEMAAVVDGRYR